MPVCKMLKVSVLQRFELIIFVEIRHFSTEIVEKPTAVPDRESYPKIACVRCTTKQTSCRNVVAGSGSADDEVRISSVRIFFIALMKYSLFAAAVIAAFLFTAAASAQRTDDILATSTGKTYTASSLSTDGQTLYAEQRKVLAETRSNLLSEMIVDALLELESKARGSTREALLAAERAKLKTPTASEIEAWYLANRTRVGGRSLDDIRPQISELLKQNAEEKLIEAYIQSLRDKQRVVAGKNVNAIGLTPADVLATVGARTITYRDFQAVNRVKLNDAEMQIFENLQADLELSIFNVLVTDEAKARNLDTSSFIATEITDKLRTFTEDERAFVESDLMRRLFTKYKVKIMLARPGSIVQNVSVDDDPQTGNAAAPVTVVMFTDFQCPACARAHPVLEHAIREYGDKVRFVIRDYPLENIHPDAFNAALAANAARAQGKFEEYISILYRNQSSLDKESLVRYASELGLNVNRFELDFSDAKTAAEVRKDQADGRGYGIGGTPAIFVNGVKVQRLSLNGFRSAIDRALAK